MQALHDFGFGALGISRKESFYSALEQLLNAYATTTHIKQRLAQSAFRSRFRLDEQEREYVNVKGMGTLRQHAFEFIRKRLAPAFPAKDGQQTPLKGHPVFIAQHATGTCCRGCLQKWHGISSGIALTNEDVDYIVNILMAWIQDQMSENQKSSEIDHKDRAEQLRLFEHNELYNLFQAGSCQRL